MCGVEGRYAVEGRKAVIPRVAGKARLRFKESRKEEGGLADTQEEVMR